MSCTLDGASANDALQILIRLLCLGGALNWFRLCSYTGLKSASDECNDNSYLSSGSEYLLSENTYSRVAGENGGNCDLADGNPKPLSLNLQILRI